MHDIDRTAPPPLSDGAIRELALQIRSAIHRPPPDDHTTWILSAAAALAPADEDRLIAALERLGRPPSELAS
jgi:hypothetical protein